MMKLHKIQDVAKECGRHPNWVRKKVRLGEVDGYRIAYSALRVSEKGRVRLMQMSGLDARPRKSPVPLDRDEYMAPEIGVILDTRREFVYSVMNRGELDYHEDRDTDRDRQVRWVRRSDLEAWLESKKVGGGVEALSR